MTLTNSIISETKELNLSDAQITSIKILVTVLDVNMYDAIQLVNTVSRYKRFVQDKNVSDILNALNFDSESLIYSYQTRAYVAREIETQELLFLRKNS